MEGTGTSERPSVVCDFWNGLVILTELTDAILFEQKVNRWPLRVIFKMAGHTKNTGLKRVVYTIAFYKERQNKQNIQVQRRSLWILVFLNATFKIHVMKRVKNASNSFNRKNVKKR